MARYRDAIEWVAFNDDVLWLEDADPILSVTASMVADLFHKSHETVKEDIQKALDKESKLK